MHRAPPEPHRAPRTVILLCAALAFGSTLARSSPDPQANETPAQPPSADESAPTPAEGAEPAADTRAQEPAPEVPRPFRATYAVEWRGFSAGTSTVELKRTSEGYVYESRNSARGIFRLALPGTITQISEFSIEGGLVVPSRYVADDGTSDTDRDVKLTFDWEANRVTGVAENQPVDVPLPPGTQDALTVQIALMRALAEGRPPRSFLMIDKDEVKEYEYVREGETTLETSLGTLETVIYQSQREGSTRLTRLWLAPSLGYVPVRAEQLRRGKRELAMQIRSLERL